MDKGDSGATPTRPRLFVNESCPLRLQMLESRIDVGNGEGYMVHPFASGCDEASHRCLRPQRLEELDERPTDRDHRFLDALLVDYLAIQRLCTKKPPVLGERGV